MQNLSVGSSSAFSSVDPVCIPASDTPFCGGTNPGASGFTHASITNSAIRSTGIEMDKKISKTAFFDCKNALIAVSVPVYSVIA